MLTSRVALASPVRSAQVAVRVISPDGLTVGESPAPDPAALLGRAGSLAIRAQVNWFPLVADRYRIDLVVEAGGVSLSTRSGFVEVAGDEGSRSARALIAAVRDFSIGSQVDWSVERVAG